MSAPYTWLLGLAAAGTLAQLTGGAAVAGAPAASPAASAAQAAQPLLTIQQLMDARIDPAADALWDSVAFIATLKGEEDRRPRTPAEWRAVRRSALALIAGVDALSLPGRRVAADAKAPGPGELSAGEIQQRIDADHRAFERHARPLEAAARKALAAIDARDADALMSAGGQIDEACEACHVIYWYPNQLRPPR